MDCSVVESKRYKGMQLVSTVDFFNPCVEDPYVQGEIAAANVLSDMYSMGICEIDTVLMCMVCSLDMSPSDRQVATHQLIAGFNDTVESRAGSHVTGGQTIQGPWPIIGGVAESICMSKDFIPPTGGKPGDVVVLTKPLGTQAAVNVKQWMGRERWADIADILTEEQGQQAYIKAMKSMRRLNKTGAILMHKYGAHACTDITGFGIVGHTQNLAEAHGNIDIIIDKFPVIANMLKLNKFRLAIGLSAETSGGLCVLLPPEKAEAFCREIEEIDGCPAWVIGRVVAGTGKAVLEAGYTVIEV